MKQKRTSRQKPKRQRRFAAPAGCAAPSDKFERSDNHYDVGYWMRYDGKAKPHLREMREGWEACNKELASETEAQRQTKTMSTQMDNRKPESPAGFARATGSAIPAGNAKLGWCADFDLLTEIVADVRNKSGSEMCCEWVDDVIISLQSRGYVKVSPNEKGQR